MFIISRVRVNTFERGFSFVDGEFEGLLGRGRHWFFDPFMKRRVDVLSERDVWLSHRCLDVIVKSGCLGDDALVLDLQDDERALVWVDGRFERVVGDGLFVLWTTFHDVRVERVDTKSVRFDHESLATIVQAEGSDRYLKVVEVPNDHQAVVYRDGKLAETLAPGRYSYWKGRHRLTVYQVSMRDETIDVAGQEIMTADKVTLRLNAVAFFRVTDVMKAVTVTADVRQALYREAQLVLRGVVGTRTLDALLSEKDDVAAQLEQELRVRALPYGVHVGAVGIKDIILPGDMKHLLNRVTEAKKAAEANLIARREETAAMRSQANTAKLLENNPVLMRLRELEVLEKISEKSQLKVILGDKGLADKVVNLL